MADINVIVLPDGTEYPVSDYYLPVAISNPTAGQVLKYDAENHVWYNGDDAEGSSVFYGTSAPASQLGVDGNLYVKYTEGTGGASDTVDALYVKLDGAWCQISTGGGGGTSDYNDLTNKPQINSVDLSGNKSLDDLGIQPSEISKTATGSIVTFSDGGDNIPVESFECEIVAQQEAGTPTPDNPLAITGFNSADIPVCGSNWFDIEGWLKANSITYTKTGDSITFTPDLSLYTNPYVFSDSDINISASVTNFGYNGTNLRLEFLNENNESQTVITSGNLVKTNFNACKVRLNWTTIGTSVTVEKPMINVGSTATPYVPYTGTLYSIAFGQTIYGGRLIYANGQWSIEATFGYVDLGALYWDTSSTVTSGIVRMKTPYLRNFIKHVSGNSIVADIMCEIYEPKSADATYSKNFGISVNTIGDVEVYDTNYNTSGSETAFKTAVTGYKLVYELATPIIIPITSSTRVKTLSGDNNIYSSTGDCEVKYFTNKADSLAELAEAVDTDFHIYSTEERIVGKWIDGRTVYEKTMNVGAITSGTTFSHGITNLDWIIDYSMFGLYAGQNKLVSPANGSSSSIGFVISSWDSTNITFTKGNLSSNFTDCYCTIRYIKSTSNTRSLNLSKGSSDETKSEEPVEEKKSEELIKEEES